MLKQHSHSCQPSYCIRLELYLNFYVDLFHPRPIFRGVYDKHSPGDILKITEGKIFLNFHQRTHDSRDHQRAIKKEEAIAGLRKFRFISLQTCQKIFRRKKVENCSKVIDRGWENLSIFRSTRWCISFFM